MSETCTACGGPICEHVHARLERRPAPHFTGAEHLPAFFRAVTERLEAGARTYGDASFARPLPATVAEIAQELLDLAGWGFVAWVRMAAVQAAAERVDAGDERATSNIARQVLDMHDALQAGVEQLARQHEWPGGADHGSPLAWISRRLTSMLELLAADRDIKPANVTCLVCHGRGVDRAAEAPADGLPPIPRAAAAGVFGRLAALFEDGPSNADMIDVTWRREVSVAFRDLAALFGPPPPAGRACWAGDKS